MGDALTFNTKRRQRPVVIDERLLTLRELSGAERDEYETSMIEFDEKGHPVVVQTDVKAKLVHLALWSGEERAYETVEEVAALPARIVNTLYDECRKLSGMDEDEAGKGSGQTRSDDSVSG